MTQQRSTVSSTLEPDDYRSDPPQGSEASPYATPSDVRVV